MTHAILKALAPPSGYKYQTSRLNLVELLFDVGPFRAAAIDSHFAIIYASETFADAAWMSRKELLESHAASVLAQEIKAEMDSVFATGVAANGNSRVFPWQRPGSEPDEILEWRILPVQDSDGNVDFVILTVENFVQSQTGREELRLATERIGVLSRELADLPEQERARMAQELHDEMGQSLTSIKLAIEAGIDATQGAARDKLSNALLMTCQIMTVVTQIAEELRPPMLDDLGLLPALLWLIERHRAFAGLTIAFKHNGIPARLGRDIETAAYRIVQESLTNVSRHALVSEVDVSLRCSDQVLMLKIEDRGAGFDEYSAMHAGRGLAGMQSRARLLGGRLSIDSEIGRGTAISVELPLKGLQKMAAQESWS